MIRRPAPFVGPGRNESGGTVPALRLRGEKNAASLKAHEKCGFRIVSEKGCDYLHREADDRDFGLEYRYERP